MSGGTAVKAGYAGGGSPTRRAAEPSCSPVFLPGERWGYRHNRPQGSALTAWGAAPPSNLTKPAERLSDFSSREGQSPYGRDDRLGEASAEYGPTVEDRHAKALCSKYDLRNARNRILFLKNPAPNRAGTTVPVVRRLRPVNGPLQETAHARSQLVRPYRFPARDRCSASGYNGSRGRIH